MHCNIGPHGKSTSTARGQAVSGRPASARDRARLYREVAALPIVSPHGHTDPPGSHRTRPSRTRPSCCSRPTTICTGCCTARACDSTRSECASRSGPVPRRSARGVAAVREPFHLFRGTPSRAVAGPCLRRGVRPGGRARAPTPPTTISTSSAKSSRPPPSGRARCSIASTSSCWRRPRRRTTRSMHHRAIREQRLARPGRHHLSARCGDRSRA